MSRRSLWLGIALLAAMGGALHRWQGRAVQSGPGVLAADTPEQIDLDSPTELHRDGITLLTRAHFDITARVLSRRDYRLDAGASLAPTDLALGWGHMSDSAVLARIRINQASRFYFWHVDDFPIPRREIETHSANIRKTPRVRWKLGSDCHLRSKTERSAGWKG